MNLAVDQPTRMIKLDLAADKIEWKRSSATGWASVAEGLNISQNKPAPDTSLGGCAGETLDGGKKRGKIDFYRIFSAECGDDAGAEAEGSRDCAGQDGDTVSFAYTPDGHGHADRRNAVGSQIDFIIISLRNDIRVRSFSMNESSVFIHFWTIDDSISFYRQYFNFGAMRFSTPHNWDDLPFVPHKAPVRRPQTGSCILAGPQFQQIEPAWDVQSSGCSDDPMHEASDDEPMGRAVVLNKISLVLSRMHCSRPGCYTGNTIAGTFCPCSSSMEEWGVLGAADGRDEMATRARYENLIGSKEESPGPAGEYAGLGSEHAEWSKEQLQQRIEHFNRMKNFFSKSDVKKMQTLYDEGRLSFLYQNSKEISCGCFSNVVMQNAVKSIGEERLCEVIRNLGEDIVPISATKYGAYTVQTIILCAASTRSQRLISQYFSRNGHLLIDHEIGNYSIQKILRFDDGLVFDLCMASLPSILGSGLGFKVFRRCVEFFKDRSSDVRAMIKQHEGKENAARCQILLQLLENS